MTNIDYTKYILTPKGRNIKAPPRDKEGVPRIDEMGVNIEAGVAEAITLSPPNFGKVIIDPVALTTQQMLELGLLGEGKWAEEREVKLQLFGVDIVVFPEALYEAFQEHKKEHPSSYISWERIKEQCVTVQVKYQPLAYGYRTINYETRQVYHYQKELRKQPTEQETKHNADFTAYVITDKVIVLAPSGTFRDHAEKVERDHQLSSGRKVYSKNNENGYYSRTTYTKRININSLLSDSTTQILGMSPLFGEYHLKACDAIEEDNWESSSIGHGHFSVSWSLETLKSYLSVGVNALFEGSELKEGITLRGTHHWVH